MKIGKLATGVCQVVGGVICVALTPVEMLCDIIGTDIDCPPYEYDERHEALDNRMNNGDYYAANGAAWCFKHAMQNFKSMGE